MALWPNARRDLPGIQPVGISGYLALQQTQQRVQRNLAYFANPGIAQTSSVPEGTFPGPVSILPPLVGGGMCAANNASDITLTTAGSLLSGGPMDGTAGMVFDQTGGLSLQVQLIGDSTFALTTSGGLALTIALAGDGTATITGAGGLSMVVPVAGNAAVALTTAADLKGNLSLAGNITPFTELSPEGLAAAVWSAAATSNNVAGSMGEKLNDAGSASNPWTEVIESGLTAAEVLRIIAAFCAGDATGLEGPAQEFKSLDGSKTRIAATYADGTRSVSALDGT
jgi:hypothetical protein